MGEGHCGTGKCAGKSGACDCNCQVCFRQYAWDLWQSECEVRRLKKPCANCVEQQRARISADHKATEACSAAEKRNETIAQLRRENQRLMQALWSARKVIR